jgi:hypothetical protein
MMQFLKPGFVQIAFGGGDSGGGGGSGNGGSAGGVIGFLGNLITAAATPTVSRADRPVQRPSVISRGDQMVATRDMPRFGISAGDTAATPEYSGFSLRGLTSTEHWKCDAQHSGAEREARAEAARRAGSNGRDDAPSPTQMAAPAALLRPLPRLLLLAQLLLHLLHLLHLLDRQRLRKSLPRRLLLLRLRRRQSAVGALQLLLTHRAFLELPIHERVALWLAGVV